MEVAWDRAVAQSRRMTGAAAAGHHAVRILATEGISTELLRNESYLHQLRGLVKASVADLPPRPAAAETSPERPATQLDPTPGSHI